MNLEMSIDEMISELDTAGGMLLVAGMSDANVRFARDKITKVSIALGKLGQKMEEK